PSISTSVPAGNTFQSAAIVTPSLATSPLAVYTIPLGLFLAQSPQHFSQVQYAVALKTINSVFSSSVSPSSISPSSFSSSTTGSTVGGSVGVFCLILGTKFESEFRLSIPLLV